ncbi:hypothetical protein J3U21_04690 [Gilliamella sp. B2776]|uniref:hypothetical protein n=1 Tax=unclassified Gilliamella TaxID=2685620 RepID=UPI002269DB89|nr:MULTISPECIES: hypothetical protein [unclassified Gilliamella]MCX8578686.1 hypothetical protein [Gilliamella sp. B2717]MCX8649568.1 hypothetical protein [Gilliamella sp. B2779]MCX8653857.1 hypothetical protein [Gilliamella sp. B2737]MCX8691442.1 hypothetical protein [Gilliamella sp. B2776]MCX8702497.1 hypothetical protein [Gilliamella sp. B2781]
MTINYIIDLFENNYGYKLEITFTDNNQVEIINSEHSFNSIIEVENKITHLLGKIWIDGAINNRPCKVERASIIDNSTNSIVISGLVNALLVHWQLNQTTSFSEFLKRKLIAVRNIEIDKLINLARYELAL